MLIYDHRGFGASDERPRLEIDPLRQLADWRDALTFAQARPGGNDTSEATQQLIDHGIRRLIETAHRDVRDLLNVHRAQLESREGHPVRGNRVLQ